MSETGNLQAKCTSTYFLGPAESSFTKLGLHRVLFLSAEGQRQRQPPQHGTSLFFWKRTYWIFIVYTLHRRNTSVPFAGKIKLTCGIRHKLELCNMEMLGLMLRSMSEGKKPRNQLYCQQWQHHSLDNTFNW